MSSSEARAHPLLWQVDLVPLAVVGLGTPESDGSGDGSMLLSVTLYACRLFRRPIHLLFITYYLSGCAKRSDSWETVSGFFVSWGAKR